MLLFRALAIQGSDSVPWCIGALEFDFESSSCVLDEKHVLLFKVGPFRVTILCPRAPGSLKPTSGNCIVMQHQTRGTV